MAGLSDLKLRKLVPRQKVFRLADGKGLCIEVQPNGARYWRFRYRFGGKAKMLSLGTYPEVGLAEARDRLDAERRRLRDGLDPSAERKAAEFSRRVAVDNTFEAVASEWIARFSRSWTKSHREKIDQRFKLNIYPWLGDKAIGTITAPQLLSVVRRIESRGALDTAHRALQNCGQVFRYAVATGRAERDPSGDLRGALPPVRVTNHASLKDPKAIGELLRAIRGHGGSLVVASALRLAPLLFVRPGELRKAAWSEFDLEAAEWRIPAEKMKARVVHIVPLSTQAIEVLRGLKPLTGSSPYLFPGVRSRKRTMSENTVNAALRRLGYSREQMTGHGFRSMASTRLNEMGWNRDAIERQLAHGERDPVRAAYNYAEHLPERRRMMQAWADYLDALERG